MTVPPGCTTLCPNPVPPEAGSPLGYTSTSFLATFAHTGLRTFSTTLAHPPQTPPFVQYRFSLNWQDEMVLISPTRASRCSPCGQLVLVPHISSFARTNPPLHIPRDVYVQEITLDKGVRGLGGGHLCSGSAWLSSSDARIKEGQKDGEAIEDRPISREHILTNVRNKYCMIYQMRVW